MKREEKTISVRYPTWAFAVCSSIARIVGAALCMKACISSRVSLPSLLLSIALKTASRNSEGQDFHFGRALWAKKISPASLA